MISVPSFSPVLSVPLSMLSTFTWRLQLNVRVPAIVPRVSWPSCRLWRRCLRCPTSAPGHATGTVRRRRPGNPAAKLQLGTAAGALYLPPPHAALLPAASKWSMPACTMTICPSKPMWQRASGCCLRRTIVLLLSPAFPIALPPVTRVHNRCLPHDACDGWEWQANIPLPGSPSD